MSPKSIISFVLVTVGILAVSVALLWRFGNTETKPIADVAGESRHSLGEGAIEVVEFSDLQCPACKSVQAPLKEILAKYDGKIKFVYRHFPLTSIHKNAMVAARASEAAAIQGKFWEMHDVLFDKQVEWAGLDNPTSKFVEYVGELGMDTAKFEQDIEAQEVKDVVNNDNLAATRYRISGTPTFFVNGEQVEFGSLDAKLAELTSSQ